MLYYIQQQKLKNPCHYETNCRKPALATIQNTSLISTKGQKNKTACKRVWESLCTCVLLSKNLDSPPSASRHLPSTASGGVIKKQNTNQKKRSVEIYCGLAFVYYCILRQLSTFIVHLNFLQVFLYVLFITEKNQKVPAHEKNSLPVLCSGIAKSNILQ